MNTKYNGTSEKTNRGDNTCDHSYLAALMDAKAVASHGSFCDAIVDLSLHWKKRYANVDMAETGLLSAGF